MEFDIYSIGDARFLAETLRATTNILARGDMTVLVAIALLIGAVWVVVQGALGGAKEIKFQNVLIAWIMYAVFFGVKADRVNVWAVDNLTLHQVDEVPMGLAFSGMVINRIGVTMARWFDQEYSTPSASDGFISGTYGTNVALQALYEMRGMDFNSAGISPAVRESLSNYFVECTVMGSIIPMVTSSGEMKPAINVKNLMRTEFAWDAMQWNNNVYQTKVAITDPTTADPLKVKYRVEGCGTAINTINNEVLTDLETNSKRSFVHAGAMLICKISGALCDTVTQGNGRPDYDRVEITFRDIGQAIIGVSLDLDKALINRIVWAAAISAYNDGSLPSGNLALNSTLAEASSKMTLTQAMQASMFERIMRPLMTFFEALMFVAAPFMALLMALGSGGLMMIGKYLQFAFWVQLWHPVFAVSSMFVQMGIQGTFTRMRELAGGAEFNIMSIQNQPAIFDEVAHWISTGAMLQSATPAVTLMLMYGTSVTASSLASRFDTSKFAEPGMEALSGKETVGNMTGGITDTGMTAFGYSPTQDARMGTIGANASSTKALAEAREQLSAAQQNYTKTDEALISSVNGMSFSLGAGKNAGADATSRAERTAQWATQQAEKYAEDNRWSEGMSHGLQGALGFQAGIGVDTSGLNREQKGKMGSTMKELAKVLPQGKLLAVAASLVSANLQGNYSRGENLNDLITDARTIAAASEDVWSSTQSDREANGIGFSRNNENRVDFNTQASTVVTAAERHSAATTQLESAQEKVSSTKTAALMSAIQSSNEMPEMVAALTDPARAGEFQGFLADRASDNDSIYSGISATPHGFVTALTAAAQDGRFGDMNTLLSIAGSGLAVNDNIGSISFDKDMDPSQNNVNPDLAAVHSSNYADLADATFNGRQQFDGSRPSMPDTPVLKERANEGNLHGTGVAKNREVAAALAQGALAIHRGESPEERASGPLTWSAEEIDGFVDDVLNGSDTVPEGGAAGNDQNNTEQPVHSRSESDVPVDSIIGKLK